MTGAPPDDPNGPVRAGGQATPSAAPTPTAAPGPLTQAVLPPFDADGLLPAGDYHPSLRDFEARFVQVAGSKTRKDIFDGYTRHSAELVSCGVDADAVTLLNGSYTTSKLDPEDIDLVVEVPRDLFDSTRPLQVLLSGRKVKAAYRCDAYPILVVPPTDPSFAAVTTSFRDYWRKWFGTTRAGLAKGRVWSRAGGLT